MDALLSNLRFESLPGAELAYLLQGATGAIIAFVLIVTRLSGLVVIGPVFGHPAIPMQIRVLLVLGMSLVITPALLARDHARTFKSLDRNQDRLLTIEEVPHSLTAQIEGLLERAGKSRADGLAVDEFFLALPAPATLIEFAGMALVEFAVGIALGLGVMILVAGLQMAGGLIDQQIGMSLGNVFNPEFQTEASLSGELLYQLGMAIFLIAGGHHLVISALVNTFETMPVGYAWVSPTAVEFLSGLIHQSLVLAVQVSAPIMGTMAVIGMAMGFLGHTIPQLNVLVVGFPVRTLMGLFLLGLILPAVAEALARIIPGGIEQLQRVLTGL